MESLEALEKKLSEHRTQLETVNQLLTGNPTDEGCLKLQTDLQKVITLTEDLVAMHKPKRGVKRVASQALNTAAPMPGDGVERKWTAGERCYAQYTDGVMYPSRIESISVLGTVATVLYLQYGETGEVPLSALKSWEPPGRSELRKGTQVSCIWKDGLMYNAVINTAVPGGRYRVKFSKYKQLEEIPIDDIVIRRDPALEQMGDKPFIPEHLKILPQDNDKVKAQKKKRIKLIKSQHKKRKAETELNRRKSSWQNFQRGGKKGAVRARKSMFSVPDTAEGRVGVIGSGRAMTATPSTRVKHKFAQVEEDEDGDGSGQEMAE